MAIEVLAGARRDVQLSGTLIRMTGDDLTADVQRLAASIVDACQDRTHGKLDYSEDSLDAVEELLDEASGFVDSMFDEQIDGLVREFGSYFDLKK